MLLLNQLLEVFGLLHIVLVSIDHDVLPRNAISESWYRPMILTPMLPHIQIAVTLCTSVRNLPQRFKGACTSVCMEHFISLCFLYIFYCFVVLFIHSQYSRK